MGSSDNGGGSDVNPSDVNPMLPDNEAELDAWKDSLKESTIEKTYNDYVARERADNLWESIMGRKGKRDD
jgi:hypothetical protein